MVIILVIEIYEIIPYCLRLTDNPALPDVNLNITDPKFSFTELREKNNTSQQLLSWSASIDHAERYQMFLYNVTHPSSLFESEIPFYNCTPPWFGPFCRFALDSPELSYENVFITMLFPAFELGLSTCYKHLGCDTWLPCLHWRDICDRKIDCFDGSDELNCWQLEVNECAPNEYRCHNGQCIPAEFFRDDLDLPDCLDRTDEGLSQVLTCPYVATSPCESHVCRPDHGFSCKQGTCEKEHMNNNQICRIEFDNIFINDICSMIMKCFMGYFSASPRSPCRNVCPNGICPKMNCPSLYLFPSFPVLYGHVHFVFVNKERRWPSNQIALPDYVCYDEKLCSDFLPPTIYVNNLTCRNFSELGLESETSYEHLNSLVYDLRSIFRMCLVTPNEIDHCHHSSMYQCSNSSKCISKHRLVDGIQDCPFNDDETFNESCSLNDVQYRFRCSINGDIKCLAPFMYQNEQRDCEDGKDESTEIKSSMKEDIYFQMICDGTQELAPVLIDGQIQTDETECEHWRCNNTYTRCNGHWACQDGSDEIDCLPNICPELHHKCIFVNDTSKVSCLPMTGINDGVVDCLGGTDERHYCRKEHPSSNETSMRFRCWNDTQCVDVARICLVSPNCRFHDEGAICKRPYGLCRLKPRHWTEVDKLICTLNDDAQKTIAGFKLSNMPIYSSISAENLIELPVRKKREISSSEVITIISVNNTRCYRGVPIRIRTTNTNYEIRCVCPPSYYGNFCQYENERVHISLKIQLMSDWRERFVFLIVLIDDQGNIQSHHYLRYLATLDCLNKYSIDLLYSTRPKDPSKTYSVRIDKFNLMISKYQGSWIYPIRYPFLPVYSLSILLTVPLFDVQPLKTCRSSCFHGQCFSYINNQSSTYCHCESGWSGLHCDKQYRCDCASGSICISESICLCSFDQHGRQCYLNNTCNYKQCFNGGQLIPYDLRYVWNGEGECGCICTEEYTGNQCQYEQTKIDLSFDNQIRIPSSLMIYFITVQPRSEFFVTKAKPIQRSVRKKILFNQDSLTLYVSFQFHIAFAEIDGNYYLIILQEKGITSAKITSEISPSHRCLPVEQIFNKTILDRHFLRRIKYYHIPCRENDALICFYDSTQMCLCNLDRETNCLEFDYTTQSTCRSNDSCENDGFCFEDDPKCPTASFCACADCYHGSRCRLSTKESKLSLDSILAYHIQFEKSINEQPMIVKISIVVTTLMFLLGLINGIFSIITFRTKTACQVGVGYYLLTTSILSIIITCILMMKLFFLLLFQTGLINNHLVLISQCTMIDFLLRFLLSASDWLSACVAIERVLNISQGIHFNKTKSKQVAKWLITIILLVTVGTHIHDPIHRQLIDDREEQRIWCVPKYSSVFKVYDAIFNVIHFSVPFAINCISAMIVILTTARTRSNAQKKISYRLHLRQQFHQHKHLLVSALILISLGVSRLIFSFLSGCMKSARESWFYLIGYFISFTPPISTFIVFILPSDAYKQEFFSAMNRFRCHSNQQ